MKAGDELTVIETTAEVVETRAVDLPAKVSDGLRSIEDRLLDESISILSDVQKFSDIEPGTSEPPAEWIEEVGERRARRRLRLANAGWMSSKEAPIGIKVSQDVASSIMKLKSQRMVGSTLNVTVERAVIVQAEPVRYPEIEVDADE